MIFALWLTAKPQDISSRGFNFNDVPTGNLRSHANWRKGQRAELANGFSSPSLALQRSKTKFTV